MRIAHASLISAMCAKEDSRGHRAAVSEVRPGPFDGYAAPVRPPVKMPRSKVIRFGSKLSSSDEINSANIGESFHVQKTT